MKRKLLALVIGSSLVLVGYAGARAADAVRLGNFMGRCVTQLHNAGVHQGVSQRICWEVAPR